MIGLQGRKITSAAFFHDDPVNILSAASAAVRQADKRRSAYAAAQKNRPLVKAAVPALRKFCGAAVFSCRGVRLLPLCAAPESRGAYHVSCLFLCYCVNSSFRCCSYRASHRFTNCRIAVCRCCSRRSAMKISPFMASVIFLSFFFLIRLFMVGVLLQICFADFVIVKGFVRLHKGGSAP